MRLSEPNFSPRQIDWVRDFLARPGQRYVLGRTPEGISVARAVDIDGFIDDFFPDPTFLGKPCLRLADVPSEARIISAVVNSRANTAIGKLAKHGAGFIDYFAFRAISGLDLHEITFWKGARAHFDAHREDYLWLFGRLADQLSQDTYERVLNFRLNYDLGEMSTFACRIDEMYLEPFLAIPRSGAVFFDVGAHNGRDSVRFLECYPEAGGCVLFEPIPNEAKSLSDRYAGEPKVEVVEAAVFDRNGRARFVTDGMASSLTDSGGDTEVTTLTLDSFCAGDRPLPNFIKMDIEGAELEALAGAASTIRRARPNLAVSVYHRASHIVEIPRLIDSFGVRYDYYLRHYSEGYAETVLFAVPRA
jgi:FkbM family methyltransferase